MNGLKGEPGQHTIKATYTDYTGLPPFLFPHDQKAVGEPQQCENTMPPIGVQVVLEDQEE